MTDTASVVSGTRSVSKQSNAFSVTFHLQSKPIVNPWWIIAWDETLTSAGPSIIPSQLFLPHLLLYCLSRAASHHLKCARVRQSCRGLRGGVTDPPCSNYTPLDGLNCALVSCSESCFGDWKLEETYREKQGSKDLSGVSVMVDLWFTPSLKWIILKICLICSTHHF